MIDPNLNITSFLSNDLDSIQNSGERSTPARRISNIFLNTFPWERIKKELGEINVVDIGCGAGYLTKRLIDEYSNEQISTYTGVDIYPHYEDWFKLQERYPNVKFNVIQSQEEFLGAIPEGTNFFMSQSAIEHIEEDLKLFQDIYKYISDSQKNIIQVHLFPAAASLWLYFFHGLRQYTFRTVSIISRLFSRGSSYCQLIELGKGLFGIQFRQFTVPILRYYLLKLFDKMGFYRFPINYRIPHLGKLHDRKKIAYYNDEFIKAMKKGSVSKFSRPSFYALIIHSNWESRIFNEDITDKV